MTVGGKKKQQNPWIAFVAKFRKENPDVPGGIEATKAAKALGPKAYADFKKSMGYEKKGGDASSDSNGNDDEKKDKAVYNSIDTDLVNGENMMAGGRRKKRSTKKRSSKKRKSKKTKKNRKSRRR
jgi:hypothetical protein